MSEKTEELRESLRLRATEVQESIDRLISGCDLLPDGARAMAREAVLLAVNLGYTQCEVAAQRGILAARPKAPAPSKSDS